jgi:hypothetical protein
MIKLSKAGRAPVGGPIGRWGRWSLVACLGFAATCPAIAQTENESSFTDSPASQARYSVALVRPQIACTDLLSLSDDTLTILFARLVPAADGVPERTGLGNLHRRIGGVSA